MSRLAIVIIGDEILSGKFAEENAAYAIPLLRQAGATVGRVCVIPDQIDVIADEVARCSSAFDWVITSGGVGPTHDDITYVGVAAAFGLPVVRNAEVAALFEAHGVPMTGAAGRMADLPAGSIVERVEAGGEPIVRTQNVLILPGVPRLFQRKLQALLPRFAGPPLHVARVLTHEHEAHFATALTAIAAASPAVAIGSYPRFEDGAYHTILTLESLDADELARVTDQVRALFAPAS